MDVRPDAPLSELASAQARERLAQVSEEMRRVRRNPDAEAVHDLRVASRRFISVLQALPECFEPKRAAKGLARMKRVLKAAGKVRDRDITLGLAVRARHGNPPDSHEEIEQERLEASRRLRRMLAKPRRRKTLAIAKKAARPVKGRQAESADAGGWRPSRPADENAVERLPALLRELFDAGRETLQAPVDRAQLHALRLETKRLRYTLELFVPCYDADLGRRIEQLKILQDMLGDINDCRASKELAQDEEVVAYLDAKRGQLIEDLRRFWIGTFDAPGECEGWMLELARRSSTEDATAGARDRTS